jgi:hypothetical protein
MKRNEQALTSWNVGGRGKQSTQFAPVSINNIKLNSSWSLQAQLAQYSLPLLVCFGRLHEDSERKNEQLNCQGRATYISRIYMALLLPALGQYI